MKDKRSTLSVIDDGDRIALGPSRKVRGGDANGQLEIKFLDSMFEMLLYL